MFLIPAMRKSSQNERILNCILSIFYNKYVLVGIL